MVAQKYLDKAGLSRLWAKITAFVESKISSSGGYLGLYPLTLSTSGWTATSAKPGYSYLYSAALADAKDDIVPSVSITADTYPVALAAGLAPTCEAKGGKMYFWAESVPTSAIQVQVELRAGPTSAQSATTLGDDTLGEMIL